MGSTVLVVHADPRIRRSARDALRVAGYAVEELEEFAVADAGQPDVIVVDWAALDPFDEYLQRIRNFPATRSSRILVMAPREDLDAAVEALEYGADDCIGIPFAPPELLARIRACLRRPAARVHSESLRAGPVVLDVAVHRVLVHGQPIELAPTEFRLMAFFLENQGRVFSRGELLRRAWAKNIKAGPRTVDVHVRRLRQQLERFGCENMIQTVRGFGYRFVTASSGGAERPAEATAAGTGNS
jgi:two-component system phosphate regulon response regulator PhoB